nr:HIT family protein [Armatimonadota bacterium]
GEGCPLCAPRSDDNEEWKKIAALEVSTLYLQRNQAYRGYSILVFDGRHVSSMDRLTQDEYDALCRDLRAAAKAITQAVQPDHINYASLGNMVPHLHWHLIPRFQDDPRWGSAIWTTNSSEMISRTLTEEEYDVLVTAINERLRV